MAMSTVSNSEHPGARPKSGLQVAENERARTPRPVSVIGLGGMGAGMAHALLAANFPVTVYNRTPAKAAPLVAAGATLAESAADAAGASPVILLSLADEAAVEKILFGEAAARLVPGSTVIDASTVAPHFARAAADRLAVLGVDRVEGCVIGNPQMATLGMLRVFASGEQEAVDSVSDVLSAVSQEVRYLGTWGRASSLKLAFNLILGVQTAGLAEALAFAESAGLDRELVLDALDNSGWRSPVLGFRADFMRRGTFTPAGFRTELMRKDLRLVQEAAADHGFALPVVDQTARRFDTLIERGRGDDDAAAVVDVAAVSVPSATSTGTS
ncbi:NAD(P)-dependent oxidoreductase [Actinoalloteichus hymeniacidonis]|uniref:Beta-hydroxyacid dehydrogenase, 3-hydroxyisobutyrate dehydrogenase n=1 Tax=Actinoalloteichus hymeniacidonis TaxID=340345 RepID=A0AAC9HQ19_9PSEU|nr:NAD(P)-dependent oxidoreductase [Actinoalloteichus hymeniacidonis]AOS62901.1 beta-hydroxyacid dehydrogenase, 3-hydroxyisobutyrate dehydrogenase [Actinoalloteichus hymeniacidonis]MBB5909066.1 3-hydroxyisobutyrate dehydrogenase [Actinoalloteichus hymeniacidonis]